MHTNNWKQSIVLFMLVSIIFSACNVGDEITPTPAEEPTIINDQVKPQPSTEPTEPTSDQPVILGDIYQNTNPNGQVITFWHPITGDQETVLLGIIQEFNNTNEWNITVIAENQGSSDDLFDKMLTFMNSTEVPHLTIASPRQSETYHLGKVLIDINELVYDSRWGLKEEEISDFFPGFFYQDVFPNFGGIRLGFPMQGSMEVTFFNQDWLRELGKDTPPITPENFKKTVCAAAMQPYSSATAEGHIGYQMNIDATLFAAWTFAFGGEIFDDVDKRFTYDSPEAIAAMQFIQNLIQDGCASLVSERNGDQIEFSQGTSLFTIGSSGDLPSYQNTVGAGANHGWSITPVPHTTTEPVQNVSAVSASILKTNPESQLAAWLFLKFFTSPEIQAKWTSISGDLPVRASAGERLGNYFSSYPAYAAAFEMLPFGVSEPPAAGDNFIRDMVAESMYAISQGADVVNVLTALNAEANAYIEEQLTVIPEPPDPWTDIDPSGQTVIFWHQQPPARHASLDELIWKFNSTNKWGITVVAEYQDDINKKMQMVINTPDAPNLVEMFQSQTANLQLSQGFTDLTSLVESIKWGLSPKDKADFYEGIYFQDIYPTFGNARLGFPPHRSMIVLYYNGDWLTELKAAGVIDFEGPPQNPEQFKAAVCAATTNPFSRSLADTNMGYQLTIDTSLFTSWTFAFGGDVFDYENNRYSYNNEGAVAAMAYLQELFNQDCSSLIVERYGDQTDFSQGTLLFTVGSTSDLPFYHSAVGEGANFRWNVAPLPHTPAESMQNVYGASLSMPKGTLESELATWLFVKYFSSPEVQAQWVQASDNLPVRASAAGGLTDYFAANSAYATAFEMLPYAVPEPSVPGYDFVRDMVEKAMVAIINGENVQATLDQLNQDANLNLTEQLEQ
jgi:multiple sugar transport system substrate-binding protein/sn-glycerol 3-phosphate transport system substrate-binding protein